MKYDNLIHVEGLKRSLRGGQSPETLRDWRVSIRLESPAVPRPQHHDEYPDQTHRTPDHVTHVGLESVQSVPCGDEFLAVASQSEGGGEFWIWDFVVVGAHPTGTIAR